MPQTVPSAQQRFNETYITTTELQRTLKVTRATVLYARRRGWLPEPIVVNDGQLTVWERATLQPYIDTWRDMLTARRAGAAKG